MNIILLHPSDFCNDTRVSLGGRRLQHVLRVHGAVPGDRLRVGLVNGPGGQGRVLSLDERQLLMEVELNDVPVEPLPLTLLLSLPRPKVLKRVLQHATTLGVKRLVLMNSYRVEKSFWQTPILEPNNLREQLLLGLEQARTTILPEVLIRKRFKPFVEDELHGLSQGDCKLVAHPVGDTPCPVAIQQPCTLAVGPEGGFIPYEVEKLQEQGFEAISLGPRILRVETAIPVLVGKLFY